MAADVKEKLGATNQAITITLDALASSLTAGRASTVVDNTVNLFLDALVELKLVSSASALANDKGVYVFAYGTSNDGTDYTDGATGSDAALTPPDPTNLRPVGFVSMPTTSGTFRGGPFSIAQAFGGILPAKWGLWVRNYTGQALGSGCSAFYQGVLGQTV